MSDRSGQNFGQGAESAQPGRNDRNFGKRRRQKKKRGQPPEKIGQAMQPRVTSPGSDARGTGDEKDSAYSDDTSPVNGSDVSATGRNNDKAGLSDGAALPKSRKKRWYRKGWKSGSAQNEEQGMRSLRSIPKKTPRPSYSPDKDNAANGRQKAGKGSNYSGGRGKLQRSHAYAALDLGTNNCRLLIAVPRQRGRFRVVDGFSRIVRLGEGLSQTGRLSEAAMDRAISALKICAGKLEGRELKRQRLIATEACRQAENGKHFLNRVGEETGLNLEIVTRETEARLAAEGCGSLMDHKSDAAVMFDIGGGSTELILVKGNRRRGHKISERIVGWTSLPMGVVTLAERFGGKDVTPDLFYKMVDTVVEEITRFEDRGKLDSVFQSGDAHLLGTSGTVTTLAGIHLELERYDRRKVDGLWMRDHEIDGVITDLLGMNYKQRAENPCIGNERADLVMAGCAILEAIRKVWPTERLRVADRGLREGLLAEMMNADRVWRSPRRRRRSVHRNSGEH